MRELSGEGWFWGHGTAVLCFSGKIAIDSAHTNSAFTRPVIDVLFWQKCRRWFYTCALRKCYELRGFIFPRAYGGLIQNPLYSLHWHNGIFRDPYSIKSVVCLFFTALINSGAARAVLAEGSELGGTVCIADGEGMDFIPFNSQSAI